MRLLLVALLLVPTAAWAYLPVEIHGTVDGSEVVLTNFRGNALKTDTSTRAIVTIEYDHSEVHSGSHYNIIGCQVIDAGETLTFGFTTGATKEIHMIFDIASTVGCTVTEYQGATFTGGTPVIPRNNNHNYPDTGTATVRANPVVTGYGDARACFAWGSGGKNPVGGSDGRGRELVLKLNTAYLWTIQAASTGVFSWDAEWYEHTAKSD